MRPGVGVESGLGVNFNNIIRKTKTVENISSFLISETPLSIFAPLFEFLPEFGFANTVLVAFIIGIPSLMYGIAFNNLEKVIDTKYKQYDTSQRILMVLLGGYFYVPVLLNIFFT